MRNFFQNFWFGRARKKNLVFFPLLYPLSKIYKLGLFLRERLKTQEESELLPIPVVSVGNLSVGGEGKTPLVMRIASLFMEAGFKPAVISRGYRRKKRGIFSVDLERHDFRICGDEPYLIARNLRCPVIVGKERKKAIEKAIEEYGAEIAILDDGFQVRGIKKDVEVLIMKALRRNQNLFPLGPMREPIENIRRSDILVLNHGHNRIVAEPPHEILDSVPVFHATLKVLNLCSIRTKNYRDYNSLRGKRIVAFSGLCDNDSFFRLLEDLGAKIECSLPFPDHHFYTQKDVKRILRHRGEMYVTTEKDAVKLFSLDIPENFYYLSVEMVIEKERDFFLTILNTIEKKRNGETTWKKEFTFSTQH